MLLVLFTYGLHAIAQPSLAPLTVEKIMRDPRWIGTSPSAPQWSQNGKTLYFNWNPDKNISDSLYFITQQNNTPQKVATAAKKAIVYANAVVYNTARNRLVFVKNDDVFLTDITTGKTKCIAQTTDAEFNASFGFNDNKVVFQRGKNVFAWDIVNGETIQLINLQEGDKPATNIAKLSVQEEWIKKDELQWLNVIKTRKEKRDSAKAYNTRLPKEKELRTIYIQDKNPGNIGLSADGRFVSYVLNKNAEPSSRGTIVPEYVTESGFTEEINGRTNVGENQPTTELYIFDREKDTVIAVKTDSLPGIHDVPDYLKDYPVLLAAKKKDSTARAVNIYNIYWQPNGDFALVDIYSQDNKDRWLMLLNAATGKLTSIDRQRDEAWIGGPGLENLGWINATTCWFQSEATGYSHLYIYNITTHQKTALTSGNYEVQQSQLSADKKTFYIVTNQVSSGEQQLYSLPVTGGTATRITTMTGGNQITLSPDEKQVAILYSYTNKPWELYVQPNKPGSQPKQITNKAQTNEFKSYEWHDPEQVTFTARDGAIVHARLYKPAKPDASKPAVIFVHGAGYLQNAHKWWSSYYHEYMFHNLLADQGYYVLDMDYRASAGYGRDWRTGIYRYMGGKDLTDNIDGANYLVQNYGVNAKRIGIYGGSYGGFITLMGLFTSPGTFAAGAALRPVTDWAHYNHGYTSNILNTPAEDSIAYRRSSPLYFAEGLQDNLLICHGMVDVNVHFQDVVRLNQRLIELGKNNWQVAMFPVEDHGFVEPSSWTDEYKRIYNLFERVLKN